jgi:hypothetical protein
MINLADSGPIPITFPRPPRRRHRGRHAAPRPARAMLLTAALWLTTAAWAGVHLRGIR